MLNNLSALSSSRKRKHFANMKPLSTSQHRQNLCCPVLHGQIVFVFQVVVFKAGLNHASALSLHGARTKPFCQRAHAHTHTDTHTQTHTHTGALFLGELSRFFPDRVLFLSQLTLEIAHQSVRHHTRSSQSNLVFLFQYRTSTCTTTRRRRQP